MKHISMKDKLIIFFIFGLCISFVLPIMVVQINNSLIINKSNNLQKTCITMSNNNYREEYPNRLTDVGMIIDDIEDSQSGAVPYKIKYTNIRAFVFPVGSFEYDCGNYELKKIS